MRKIKTIVKDSKGNILGFNLSSTESNDDWLRSSRLKKRAEAGDKQATAELAKLDKAPMYADF